MKSKTNYRNVSLRSKKTGRLAKLLIFSTSHSIVTHGSESLSCATTPHPSCFLNLNGMFGNFNILTLIGIEGVEGRP